MPTIKDVAERVGASTATVSHVLNSTRFVSQELRQRVLEAIQSLNYQPNAIARSLVKKRTHTIGIIISDILNPFYTAIVRGIEDVTYQSGYNVVLCNTDEDPEKETLYIRILLEKRVDGLILSSAFQEGVHPYLEQLKTIPLLTVVRKIRGLVCDAVMGDNTSGGYKAVEHLLGLGHRRIGIICGPPGLSTGAERLEGCKRAMGDHGLAVDRLLVRFGDFKKESGHALAKEILKAKPPPTAIFVMNNRMAVGALQALKESGVRIPEDVSLVSFDDMEWYSFLNHPLTTIDQSPYQMGKAAGETLLQRISGKRKRPKRILSPSRLIVRESTASVGRGRG